MNETHYSIGETAEKLGISVQTLRDWDKKQTALTPTYKSKGGHRRYSERDIQAYLNGWWEDRDRTWAILYTRVTIENVDEAYRQATQRLKGLREELEDADFTIIDSFFDVGLKNEQPNFQEALRVAITKNANTIYTSYQNDISSFNQQLITKLIESHGIQLKSLYGDEKHNFSLDFVLGLRRFSEKFQDVKDVMGRLLEWEI